MMKSILMLIIMAAMIMVPAIETAYGSIQQVEKQQKKESPVKEAVKVIYSCPMHPEEVSDKPGKCPKCGMNLVKKEVAKVVYTCPMHPEEISDRPGKCPKCGMKLVIKEPEKKGTLKNQNKGM